jgi:hypothetical protein
LEAFFIEWDIKDTEPSENPSEINAGVFGGSAEGAATNR